jgi:hypothetical protein
LTQRHSWHQGKNDLKLGEKQAGGLDQGLHPTECDSCHLVKEPMNVAEVIRQLEREWDLDVGFFGRLRSGVFDVAGLKRAKRLIKSVKLGKARLVDRRLVSLLWYIPVFMAWQRKRVQEVSADLDRLQRATEDSQDLLQDILGVP